MDFKHNETRQMLQDTVTRVLHDSYQIETRHSYTALPDGFCRKRWAQFADLGLIGALFSEADGGFAGQGFDIMTLFESLGGSLVVEPFFASAIQGGQLLSLLGNAEQKEMIEQIISGQLLMAFGHFEPNSRYEMDEVSSTATQTESGWVINGAKSVVINGDSADQFILSARTQTGSCATEGISLFVVDADTAGLKLQTSATVDGGRTAELFLENVKIEHSSLLGDVGQGYAAIETATAAGILALCSEALGVMEAAKDQTLEFMKTRNQFGQPIGSFQVLQHKMADHLIEIEQVRSAVTNCAAAFDSNRVTRERAVSAAKYMVGCAGRNIAEGFIQMHGGMGMTWEMPLAHFAKRLIMIDHLLGDADHHLERYILLDNGAAEIGFLGGAQ